LLELLLPLSFFLIATDLGTIQSSLLRFFPLLSSTTGQRTSLPSPPAAAVEMNNDEVVLVEDQEEMEAEGEVAGGRSNWSGSETDTSDIIWLNKSRRIQHGTICRPPKNELRPIVQPNERVVFLAHFERGFGLPLSDFASEFFSHFELQPHHLTANAIMTLSCFVTFCEAYLGLYPTLELFFRFFRFRKQTMPDPDVPASQKLMTEIGACTIIPKTGTDFPKILCMESAKGWNKTFLYVKSPEGGDDTLRLPPFIMAPPTSMTNWKSYPSRYSEEVTLVERRLRTLKKQGLTGDDLAATFISRRVSPLQKRAHKMHQMSGHRDITRHSTFELTNTQVCHRVHAISKSLLSEEWDFGVDPYSRGNPPPEVCTSFRHRYYFSPCEPFNF
jgi:hypothetical protein